jgi:hypothetical protein
VAVASEARGRPQVAPLDSVSSLQDEGYGLIRDWIVKGRFYAHGEQVAPLDSMSSLQDEGYGLIRDWIMYSTAFRVCRVKPER